MSDFSRTRTIKKLRKRRQCDYCCRRIEIGEPAINATGVFEGDFYSTYFCPWCNDNIVEIENDGKPGTFEYSNGGLHERISDYMPPNLECPLCQCDSVDYGANTRPYNECIEYECLNEKCGHKWVTSLNEHFGIGGDSNA
jgi:hypothetical protein